MSVKLEFNSFLRLCLTCRELRGNFGVQTLVRLLQNFSNCDDAQLEGATHILQNHVSRSQVCYSFFGPARSVA